MIMALNFTAVVGSMLAQGDDWKTIHAHPSAVSTDLSENVKRQSKERNRFCLHTC